MNTSRRITAVFLIALVISASLAAAAPQSREPLDTNPLREAISAPPPEYPYEARRQWKTGAGIAVMKVDTATGVVTDAYMAQSTGEPILDAEAIRAFRRWRFKPGTVSMVRTPIAFLMGGRGVRVSYEVKSQDMDDKLAAFLGKGTVLKGPIPQYPRSEQWTFKRGKGVYELHVNGEGRVSDVRVLTSSGDSSFDRAAVGTLGKWRLRRGPLILELPLSFTLTPTSFAVQLPKHEGAHRPRRR